MRVRVILTDLNRSIEGESAIFGAGIEGDTLEKKRLGFWVKDWKEYLRQAIRFKGEIAGVGTKATVHENQVFIPWTSALYVEVLEDKDAT